MEIVSVSKTSPISDLLGPIMFRYHSLHTTSESFRLFGFSLLFWDMEELKISEEILTCKLHF